METPNVRLRMQRDALNVEMEQYGVSVGQRYNFSSAKMKPLTAKMDLMTVERDLSASKFKWLVPEVQCVPNITDEANFLLHPDMELQNAICAKGSKSCTTGLKRDHVNLKANLQEVRMTIDGRSARMAELETRISKSGKTSE